MLKLYSTVFVNLKEMGKISVLRTASSCEDDYMTASIERFLVSCDAESIPCTHAFIITAKSRGEAKEGVLTLRYSRAEDRTSAALYESRGKDAGAECIAMWAVAPCSNVSLSKTDQSEVVDAYNYAWRQDRIRNRMEEMLNLFGSEVSVDLHSEEAQALIESIESEATRSIDKYGCDEDWSLDNAMSEQDAQVRAFLRIFQKGDNVHIVESIGCHSIAGIVTDADETEVTVKRNDTGEEESVYLTHIANANIYI